MTFPKLSSIAYSIDQVTPGSTFVVPGAASPSTISDAIQRGATTVVVQKDGKKIRHQLSMQHLVGGVRYVLIAG